MAVRFFTGTQSQFDAKKTANQLVVGALYYINDSRIIFRATANNAAEVYGAPFEVVAIFPATNQEQGKLYVSSATYEARVWNGSGWTVVSLPITTAIASTSTDSEIPTAKAVYDAIDALPKTGTAEGNVPILGSGGKLNTSVLPTLSITDFAGTVVAKTALANLSTAEKGDYAIVNGDGSNDGCYILNGTYSTVGDWVRISAAVSPVAVDPSITENGTNPVAGGAIYTALNGKADTNHSHSYSDLTSGLEWESIASN